MEDEGGGKGRRLRMGQGGREQEHSNAMHPQGRGQPKPRCPEEEHLRKSSARTPRDALVFHLEEHKFIHSEPSFHCMEMDVSAHVILTLWLSHPYIKQPREPELIHLFAMEDGSVSKLFY